MSSRYMFDGMESGEKLLMEDEAFPLVREVSFKYGLKVFRVAGVKERFSENERYEFTWHTPMVFLCARCGHTKTHRVSSITIVVHTIRKNEVVIQQTVKHYIA